MGLGLLWLLLGDGEYSDSTRVELRAHAACGRSGTSGLIVQRVLVHALELKPVYEREGVSVCGSLSRI